MVAVHGHEFDLARIACEEEVFKEPFGDGRLTGAWISASVRASKACCPRSSHRICTGAFIPDNDTDAVALAFSKYWEHSIPFAATRNNFLVVDDALDAAATLNQEYGP
jgi:hypothetical protein